MGTRVQTISRPSCGRGVSLFAQRGERHASDRHLPRWRPSIIAGCLFRGEMPTTARWNLVSSHEKVRVGLEGAASRDSGARRGIPPKRCYEYIYVSKPTPMTPSVPRDSDSRFGKTLGAARPNNSIDLYLLSSPIWCHVDIKIKPMQIGSLERLFFPSMESEADSIMVTSTSTRASLSIAQAADSNTSARMPSFPTGIPERWRYLSCRGISHTCPSHQVSPCPSPVALSLVGQQATSFPGQAMLQGAQGFARVVVASVGGRDAAGLALFPQLSSTMARRRPAQAQTAPGP
jgi:hypothetical protein